MKNKAEKLRDLLGHAIEILDKKYDVKNINTDIVLETDVCGKRSIILCSPCHLKSYKCLYGGAINCKKYRKMPLAKNHYQYYPKTRYMMHVLEVGLREKRDFGYKAKIPKDYSQNIVPRQRSCI